MDLQSEIASDLAEIRRLHARAKSLRKLFIGLDFGITCTGVSLGASIPNDLVSEQKLQRTSPV